MKAVNSAPTSSTRIQSPNVPALKLSNPTWFIMPSTAAVIPLARSQGTNARM